MAKQTLRAYCPTGRTQIFGTCYAYAPTYVARTAAFCIANRIDDVSNVEANAFSDAFVASIVSPQRLWNPHCSQHGTAEKSLRVMRDVGVRKIADFGDRLEPLKYLDERGAEQYRIASYLTRETKASDSDLSDFDAVVAGIKEQLSSKRVVICAIEQPGSFYANKSPTWKPAESERLSRRSSNHCMTIVGFDEGHALGDAFEVHNNYPGWGKDGFAHVRTKDFVRMLEAYYTILE